MLSPRLRFALSTCPLVCGCLTDPNLCLIFSLSHQSLNGLSLNCFPLSDMISPGRPNLHTMLSRGYIGKFEYVDDHRLGDQITTGFMHADIAYSLIQLQTIQCYRMKKENQSEAAAERGQTNLLEMKDKKLLALIMIDNKCHTWVSDDCSEKSLRF
ncbi:hypothetical protein Tco_1414302 [Tanacetum coccineum]